MSNEAWIVAGVRSPMGAMSGALAAVPAAQLGATCIQAVLSRAKVDGGRVDEVIMGNVLGAGQGQNPARQAAIGPGLPVSVGAAPANQAGGSCPKAGQMAAHAGQLGGS